MIVCQHIFNERVCGFTRFKERLLLTGQHLNRFVDMLLFF